MTTMIRQYLAVAAFSFIALGSNLAVAQNPGLETSDMYAYSQSLNRLYVGLTQQEMADLNWQIALIAFGDKPAAMTDEEHAIALMTFLMEHQDIWLERLRPYEGFSAPQLMELPPRVGD